MARIRSIHPGVFTDEAWASVSIAARWLAQGILTEADDNGVFEWKPLQLKMRIFPADNVDLAALLAELRDAGIVTSFVADGKQYGAVRNFCKYQRPRKPKAWFPIPEAVKAFVAFGSSQSEGVPQKSELIASETPTVPQKSEKSPQMEDGGCKRNGRGRVEKNVLTTSIVDKTDDDVFSAYSTPEIDRLQIEFQSEDVRTALGELWEWSGRKTKDRSERKRIIFGALENRRGASDLITAKANAPPVTTTPQLAANRMTQSRLSPRMAR